MKTEKIIEANLKLLIERNGIKISELATQMGLHTNSLNSYFMGVRNSPWVRMGIIIDFLAQKIKGFKVTDLFEPVEEALVPWQTSKPAKKESQKDFMRDFMDKLLDLMASYSTTQHS